MEWFIGQYCNLYVFLCKSRVHLKGNGWQKNRKSCIVLNINGMDQTRNTVFFLLYLPFQPLSLWEFDHGYPFSLSIQIDTCIQIDCCMIRPYSSSLLIEFLPETCETFLFSLHQVYFLFIHDPWPSRLSIIDKIK